LIALAQFFNALTFGAGAETVKAAQRPEGLALTVEHRVHACEWGAMGEIHAPLPSGERLGLEVCSAGPKIAIPRFRSAFLEKDLVADKSVMYSI
jgi:hypothetical protein